MAPHNLLEVIAAARHLIASLRATLDELDALRPRAGPADRRSFVGLDGIREVYETGRGNVPDQGEYRQMEADVRPRKRGIVVTELPYGIGPEKVIAKIKDLVQLMKLDPIADVRRSHRPRASVFSW